MHKRAGATATVWTQSKTRHLVTAGSRCLLARAHYSVIASQLGSKATAGARQASGPESGFPEFTYKPSLGQRDGPAVTGRELLQRTRVWFPACILVALNCLNNSSSRDPNILFLPASNGTHTYMRKHTHGHTCIHIIF